ncbi:hypothetical protein TCDM_12296 [Trypanosoma cruzi Dm28c]|uniref:Uncharacterized protein n=1 Tax=Trypanosoma cruzi Dm28c TaxID=1416333 RepID=V5AZP5_TRYCR|nr:hypothetical protein TCDM_12296 [Trypanosoma cruzi Dm28c]
MGSSACCCSPQPSHRRANAARRAQSLVCVGTEGSKKNMTAVASPHRESERSKRRKIIRGERNAHAKQKQKKNTAAGCGCVCGAAGVCPPWPQRKQNKRKEMCAPPTGPRRTPTRHGSLSAPFVAAPPHACSRRGAQGRRRERVGGCASGAVGRKHTAPLTGRVQQETIKEGKAEKKNVHSDCPRKQERREGSKKAKLKKSKISQKNENRKTILKFEEKNYLKGKN